MTSNDNNYITVEMFNGGIREIKTGIQDLATQRKVDMAMIDGKLTEIRSEIKVTNSRIDSTNSRIDNMAERLEDLKFFGTVGLAIIAVLIALVALVPAKREKSERSEDLSPRNIRDIRAIIREEIAMSNSQVRS